MKLIVERTKDDLLLVTAINKKGEANSQIVFGCVLGPVCYLSFRQKDMPDFFLEPVKASEVYDWMLEHSELPTRDMKQQTWDAVHVFLSTQVNILKEKKELCKSVLPTQRVIRKAGL